MLHHWVFCQALHRHYRNMSCLITLKIGVIALHSQLYQMEKIVRDKIFDFERHAWDSFCKSHLYMRVAHSCLENVPPFCFWSLANQFPDLVSRLHIQVKLRSNFGLNGCIPWLQNTDGAIFFICKEEIESVTHFLLDCSYFRNNFDSLWNKLKLKIAQSN